LTDSLLVSGPPQPQPGSTAVLRESITHPWLSLDVSAPFSHAALTIDDQGNLDYHASAYPPGERGARKESKSIRVSNQQVAALKRLIDESGVFSQQGKWDIKGADCLSFALRVNFSTGDRSFNCHCGCPEEFEQIRTRLQELLGQAVLIEGF
jgi:hypothetical protein